MAERQGIEIDRCPSCRGIWLDRGELDKIVERSAGGGVQDDDDDHRGRDSRGNPRKRGFFAELFD